MKFKIYKPEDEKTFKIVNINNKKEYDDMVFFVTALKLKFSKVS